MNPLTREWVDKAEGDFMTACRELRVRYPGDSADKTEAKTAIKSAEVVREFIRGRLGFV